jgi:hypothetical protein
VTPFGRPWKWHQQITLLQKEKAELVIVATFEPKKKG